MNALVISLAIALSTVSLHPALAKSSRETARFTQEADRLTSDQRRQLEELRRQFNAELAQVDRSISQASPEDQGGLRDQRLKLATMREEIDRRLNGIDQSGMSEVERAEFVAYYRRATSRMEKYCAQSFPKEGGKSVYGRGRVKFTIEANGQLEEAKVVMSAGNAAIDSFVVQMLRDLSPYEAFTSQMHERADRAVIEVWFEFFQGK
jgi:TonB family protein